MKELSQRRYVQFIAACAVALAGPNSIIHATWASPALPILQSSNSPLGRPATSEEASWIVSIKYVTVLPGAFLGGYIAQKFGRKMALLLGGALSLIAWIIIIFAQDIVTIYVARCIAGLCVGMISVLYIYVGEIADDDIRGMLGMVASIVSPFCAMIVLTAGPYISYKALALLCAAIPVLFISFFVWMPETPQFYIEKGDIDAAKRSLVRLAASNTSKDSIDKKILKIEELIHNDMSKTKITVRQFLTTWKYLKPFILITVIAVTVLLSGQSAIEAYMQTIISASQSSLSPEVSSIIFGVVKLPPGIVATLLCDKIGRKPLFVISGIGCAIALLGEGAYFYIQEFHEDYVKYLLWLPTTALSAFMIMNPLGHSTMLPVLLSEIFSSESKEISTSFLQLFTGTTGFLVTKMFSPLSEILGVYTIFWFFSCMCVLSCAYIYLFIPETKGKTFAEIQAKLHRKKHIPVDDKIKTLA